MDQKMHGAAQTLLDQLQAGSKSDKHTGRMRVKLAYTHKMVRASFGAILSGDTSLLTGELDKMAESADSEVLNQYLVSAILSVSKALLTATGDIKAKEPSNDPAPTASPDAG